MQVPRSLLRADGRSIYQRHGGVRYATRAQLAMEERLVAQAGADAAPRLTRADAARALGADLARLEDTLAGHAQEIQDHHPERTQLTADQAAAVLSVPTDGKRVSVINAPAGSGKTRVMTEAARVWAAAGRPVVGITPSQSARNTVGAFFDLDGTLVAGYTAAAQTRDRVRRRDLRMAEYLTIVQLAVRFRLGRRAFETLIEGCARTVKGRLARDVDEMGERIFR